MRTHSFIKFLVLLSIIFLNLNSSFAEIKINNIEDSYYIGQNIIINSEINYKKDIYGFIEYIIKCNQKETFFYKSPITIKFNEATIINNIEFFLSENFVKSSNSCYIIAKLLNQENEALNDYKSKSFKIERNFNLSVNINKNKFLAGEIINLKIYLNVPNQVFNGAIIDIIINKKLARYESNEKYNEIEYALPLDIKSGNHEGIIQIEDIYGNKDEEIINIEIMQTPTTLRNVMLKEIYYTNKDKIIEFRPTLYDQGYSDINNANIIIKIFDPNNKEIISDQVLSKRKFGFELTNKSIPGNYKVISKFNDIIEENVFKVINSEYKQDIDLRNNIENNLNNKNKKFTEEISEKKEIDTTNNNNSKWIIIWRFLTVIPAIYLIYRLTKQFLKNKKRVVIFKHKFKTDKFYGLHKKRKKVKFILPKKIKADPKNHEED
jgi:hypothetical protein